MKIEYYLPIEEDSDWIWCFVLSERKERFENLNCFLKFATNEIAKNVSSDFELIGDFSFDDFKLLEPTEFKQFYNEKSIVDRYYGDLILDNKLTSLEKLYRQKSIFQISCFLIETNKEFIFFYSYNSA